MNRHPLLVRQLKHCFGSIDQVPEALSAFVAAVGDAYVHADQDRAMIEHSLEQMSQELTERNRELRRQLEEKNRAEAALQKEKAEQQALIQKLAQAHEQLLQSEKMASIGQLAAGVAHEINNPVGYVSANLGTLEEYLTDLFHLLDAYEAALAQTPPSAEVQAALDTEKEHRDLDFLRGDIPVLMRESREGLGRVRKIVQDLKDFSHPDTSSFSWSDIHQGLDSTLNIVHNELKYKAEVIREYATLPKVQCNLSQLNQVFMNLLVNASHAIRERGVIRVRTGQDQDDCVWVEISDSGCGIAPENLSRIFNPFFTTKPVGKGTGLGLSLSYRIIERHHGRIEVRSTVGEGSTFRITVPVMQQKQEAALEA